MTGIDDPTGPATAGQAIDLSDPGGVFSSSHFLNEGKDFTV